MKKTTLAVLAVLFSATATADIPLQLVAMSPPVNSMCAGAMGLENKNAIAKKARVQMTYHGGEWNGKSENVDMPAPAQMTVFVGCTAGAHLGHHASSVDFRIVAEL